VLVEGGVVGDEKFNGLIGGFVIITVVGVDLLELVSVEQFL
jgi:hypothetical protein